MTKSELRNTDKRRAIRKECEDIYWNRKNVIPKLRRRTIGSGGINLPLFIKQQYDYLYDEMIQYGEIYGGFYQIKDILEILLKLPTLIFVEGISKYVVSENVDLYDEHSDSKEKLKIAKELLETLLIKAPSLGDWEQLAKLLSNKKMDDIPVANEKKPLYAKIHLAMKKIEKIFGNFAEVYIKKSKSNETGEVTQQDNTIDDTKKLIMKFSAYRNVKIGHGATNLDIEKLFTDFKYFLGLLNSILDDSSYNGLEFIENGKELVIKDVEFSISISVFPFVKEKNESNAEQLSSAISMMESYFGKKKVAYLLNYNTGMIEENLDLYKILHQVSTKLSIPLASSSGMKDDEIDTEDYKSTFQTIPFAVDNEVFATTVTNWLSRSDKGILLLQAERGMGKSVFARMVTNEEEIRVKKYNGKKLSLNNNGNNYLVWSYFCNDTFSSAVAWFSSRLFEFFGDWFRENEKIYRKTIKAKDPYNKARSQLEVDISSGTDTIDCWAKYFDELTTKVKNTENKRLVIIIDGIDEIDLNTSTHLHFEKYFDADKLPVGMYIIFLERIQDGDLGNNCKNRPYSHELQRIATENVVITRTKNIEYVKTLKAFISNNFVKRKDEIEQVNKIRKKRIPQKNSINEPHNEVEINTEDILKIAEYRFVYITALLKIFLSNPTEFENYLRYLENNKNTFIVSYLNSLSFIGQKFRDKLLDLLIILHLLKKQAVTREELSYLVFNHDIDNPDFQMNFLLQNVGMVSSKRSALGNTYLIEHEVWNNEIESDFYKDKRLAVCNELRQRAESVVRENVSLPHVRNWTVLISNFLDNELYLEKTVVENLLRFMNSEEHNLSIYVQERFVHILETINNRNKNLPKALIFRVQEKLAQACYFCGKYDRGLKIMEQLLEEVKEDNTIDNNTKSSFYFGYGAFVEYFEKMNGTYPRNSEVIFDEAMSLITEDSVTDSRLLTRHKCACLYKLGSAAMFRTDLSRVDDCLEKIKIEEKQITDSFVTICLHTLRFYLYTCKLEKGIFANDKERLNLQEGVKESLEKVETFINSSGNDEFNARSSKSALTESVANFMGNLKVDFYTMKSTFLDTMNNDYTEAISYIDKAINAASEAILSTSLKGEMFDERQLLKLKIAKVRLLARQRINTEFAIDNREVTTLLSDIDVLIKNLQQKYETDNSWLEDEKDELAKLRIIFFASDADLLREIIRDSDYGNDYNIVMTNISLADQAFDAKQVKQHLTDAISLIEKVLNLKGRVTDQNIKRMLTEHNDFEANTAMKQILLNVLGEANYKIASISDWNDKEIAKQYLKCAICIYEAFNESFAFEEMNTIRWLSWNDITTTLVKCYHMMVKMTNAEEERVYYSEKQIELLEDHKDVITEESYKTALAQAYLNKGEYQKSSVSAQESLSNAIKLYRDLKLNYTKSVKDNITLTAQDIEANITECLLQLGITYLNMGLYEINNNIILDAENISKAINCFKEMLKNAENTQDHGQCALADLYLCELNSTLFEVEKTNDIAFFYFQNLLRTIPKLTNPGIFQDEDYLKLYKEVLKGLYYSLILEQRNIEKEICDTPDNVMARINSSLIQNIEEKHKELLETEKSSKKYKPKSKYRLLRFIAWIWNKSKLQRAEKKIEALKKDLFILNEENNKIRKDNDFIEQVNNEIAFLKKRLTNINEMILDVENAAQEYKFTLKKHMVGNYEDKHNLMDNILLIMHNIQIR